MPNLVNTIFQSIKSALNSIQSHAIRSLLTVLGIIIGVASVIAVITIMEGLSSNISRGLNDLSSDMVTLRAFTTVENRMLGIENTLSYSDFELLKRRVGNIENITPVMQPTSLTATVQYGRTTAQTQIIGTESSYQKLVKTFPEQGRFLKLSDDLNRRRVVFIGKSLAKKLGMPKRPIGEFVKIAEDWFRVIGLAESKGDLFGMDQDNYLMAPFSTIKSVNGSEATENIMIRFRPSATANLVKIKQEMYSLLKSKYKLKGNLDDKFEFITAEKMRKNFSDITNGVSIVLGGVVSISLLVGGVGIMNIMLVSVTERTKEIGIQKAIGATSSFILLQFLIEALILSALGGVLGVLTGYAFASFISLFISSMGMVSVPLWSITLSLVFTTLIGLIFGILPAIKAAKLNPIQALNYE